MERIKFDVTGIVFDLDGTIVDSSQAYMDAAKTTFSKFGKEKLDTETAKEIPKRFELSLPLKDLIGGIDEKKFREVYLEAYYRATYTKTKPFANIELALENLSKRTKLALTTKRHVSGYSIMT